MKRSPLKRNTPLKQKTQLRAKTPLKNKRKSSNPVPTADDCCIICKLAHAHLHEAFFGTANRELSIQYGLQVRLCQEHHQGTYGVHGSHGHALDLQIKQMAQEQFEETYSRDEFMKLFGRNYLIEEAV